ncbi:MAG: PAS domain-containing sensor histidine kinase [Bacteroidota bacterium]|nr:PAS domain-containing sensor histidine kinase [Bacteroidota bacterium]
MNLAKGKNGGEMDPNIFILNQLAAQSNQVFFLYNPATKHLDFINPTFQEIWNTRKKEVDIQWLIQSIHPDDRTFVEENWREFLNGNVSQRIEFRLQLPKEVVKWISLSAYYIYEDEQKKAIIGFAEDVTGRKERELNSAKFNGRKNAVLEIISHDVKGAMGMIRTMNTQIKKHVKSLNNPDLEEYTRIIDQHCENNLKMIHGLLDSELVESADVALIRKRLDMVDTIKQVFNEYQHSDEQLERTFQLETAHDAIYVEVDENLFTQVFNNLISNALKFTQDGGTITVCLEETEDQVQACVKDNGIGIPEKLQAVLFDRFTMARRYGLKGERPSGLGLSIVKRIIELHGGKIWVESQENKGTAFYFKIPKMTELKPV